MSVVSSAPVSVRPATAGDVDALAALAHRTFKEAFSHTVAPEGMVAYLTNSFAPEQVAREVADPQSLFLLALAEGEMVGYAKLHWGDPLPNVIGVSPVKLWRLYTLGTRQSTGVGAMLLTEASNAARTRGGQTLWLTVNQGNARAIAFYERNGFVKTGETLFNLGSETHHDFLMERSL